MTLIYRFFFFLGIVFFIILLAIVYFLIADPFNIRPLLFGNASESAVNIGKSVVPTSDKLFNLEDAKVGLDEVVEKTSTLTNPQKAALEAVGLDASAIPAQFTAKQTECFVGILGQARVDEIVGGSVPTMSEFIKAKDCLQ